MLNALLQFDNQITRLIALNIPHNVIFDYFFAFLSLRGNSIIVWGIVVLLLVIFEEKRDRKFIWYLAGSFLTSFAVSEILKSIFARPRPVFHFVTLIGCPTNFSFPSGHATCAFAAAVILAHFDAKRKWIYFVIASLVGLSRIYLGCHYVSDIVGGALLGFVISHLILLMIRRGML